jgi:hypothetical protein
MLIFPDYYRMFFSLRASKPASKGRDPMDNRMRHATMSGPARHHDGLALYWAYGSNLNLDAMVKRCPAARDLYPLTLNNCALVFRGVADVVHRKGSSCPGAVWSITKTCERALDRFEGVASGCYTKRYFHLKMKSGLMRPVLFYKMRERGICPPSVHYLQIIEQGYKDFNLDLIFLEQAVEEAWKQHEVTPSIQSRFERKGRPVLGRSTDLGSGCIG